MQRFFTHNVKILPNRCAKTTYSPPPSQYRRRCFSWFIYGFRSDNNRSTIYVAYRHQPTPNMFFIQNVWCANRKNVTNVLWWRETVGRVIDEQITCTATKKIDELLSTLEVLGWPRLMVIANGRRLTTAVSVVALVIQCPCRDIGGRGEGNKINESSNSQRNDQRRLRIARH